MARARYTDPLQVNRFHLLDVSFNLPWTFLPIFGFQSVTMPVLNINYKKIKPGNYEYMKYGAVESADVTPITLEQGVTLANSDFGDWALNAPYGVIAPRRLMLIQFTNINVSVVGGSAGTAAEKAGKVTSSVMNKVPGGSGAGAIGLFEDGARFPGRAWLLSGCRPLSYKPGSDFDGKSGEISIATLELTVEEFSEFSLGI